MITLLPLLALLAVLIKLGDGGPVLFRQQRVGQNGRLFRIWKFRTMQVNSEKHGLSVTAGHDVRVTTIGRVFRRWKLDELPQLWNVLRGDMSLVGPRPEVPCYVGKYTSEQRQVLSLKPGITDPASLEFRNEEQLLQSAENVETYYMEVCVPRKIALSLEYARHANLWTDSCIIWRTLFGTSHADARSFLRAR